MNVSLAQYVTDPMLGPRTYNFEAMSHHEDFPSSPVSRLSVTVRRGVVFVCAVSDFVAQQSRKSFGTTALTDYAFNCDITRLLAMDFSLSFAMV